MAGNYLAVANESSGGEVEKDVVILVMDQIDALIWNAVPGMKSTTEKTT